MKRTTHTPKRKRTATTPLLDWRPVPSLKPATRAGQHVCRRYRINPVIADLIANLAGLGVNVEVMR